MAPKLDKNALANALLRKNKGKQTQPAEVIPWGSNPSFNVPTIVPPVAHSSTSKAPTRKRRRSHSPNRGATQPSTSRGGGGRSSNPSCKQIAERPPFETSELWGMCLFLWFDLCSTFMIAWIVHDTCLNLTHDLIFIHAYFPSFSKVFAYDVWSWCSRA